ncbi:MAG: DUF4468 domain-containing protein [Marinilabiliaceae bacterium]|nr:DUF4468 domain-containing protein [Marinilabiliaceae bacterium]
MRKLILNLFLMLTMVTSIFSQTDKFVFTKNGLKNANDENNSYVVIDIENVTANELYKRALRYVHETFKNPQEVIKGDIPDEYLRIHVFSPTCATYKNVGLGTTAILEVNANYYIEMRFRDQKVRLEIGDLKLNIGDAVLNIIGNPNMGYAIYKKNGELAKSETKNELEHYFNSNVDDLKTYLQNISKKIDW